MRSGRMGRWIGAIPYFPDDPRLWIRGPSGSMKPNAGRPIGLLLWVGIGVLVACVFGAIVWLALG